MDGRDFLDTAERLLKSTREADWRTVAGRAYYALFLEARDCLQRWEIPLPHRQAHRDVRVRLEYANFTGLKIIANALGRLAQLRNKADYDLVTPGPFLNNHAARVAVETAREAIASLHQIDASPTERGNAIDAIRRATLPP